MPFFFHKRNFRKRTQPWKSRLFGCLLVCIATGSLTGKPNDPAPILFVVDASGSMIELFGGVPRMVAARVMLLEELKRLDPKTPVGLVAYGNRITGCRSHRIYAPIRTQNRRSLSQQIQKLYPAGSTPIANTLRLIGRHILPYYPKATIVIVSDGQESCGGDPVREVQKLMRLGYKIRFQVIGLDVDSSTALQLKAIARAGNGNYFNAKSQLAFANALTQSTQAWETKGPKARTAPSAKALLRITKVFGVRKADGTLDWHIRYVFETKQTGRYLVRIAALDRPVSDGKQGRILGDRHLLASHADSFYGVQKAKGEIQIPEKSLGSAKKIPFYLQGELWDVSGVPESLFVSKPVRQVR